MRKNYKNLYIISLLITLIIVNMRYGGFVASLGASIFDFAFGLILGFIFTGFFMIFYNLFKPDNKVGFSKERTVIIGLIFAILNSLLVGG